MLEIIQDSAIVYIAITFGYALSNAGGIGRAMSGEGKPCPSTLAYVAGFVVIFVMSTAWPWWALRDITAAFVKRGAEK